MDVGEAPTTFTRHPSLLAYPRQMKEMKSLGDNTYEMVLRDSNYILGQTTTNVGLSSRLSGNLRPNLHYSKPMLSDDEISNLRQQATTLTPELLERFERVLGHSIRTEHDPCPFEGLSFPLISGSSIIRDPHGILASRSDQVLTVFPVPSTETVFHLPLLSFSWLSNEDGFQSSRHPERFKITCQDETMNPSLSVYSSFLRQVFTESSSCLALSHSSPRETASDSCSTLLWNRLHFTASKLFPPTISFIGSIAAQEAIKCITGTDKPLDQWLLFDSPGLAELLPPSPPALTQELSAHSATLNTVSTLSRSPDASKSSFELNDSPLLFPLSQYPTLATASLLLLGCDVASIEVGKNLAFAGVCSRGTVIASDPNPDSSSATDESNDRILSQLTQLWRTGCGTCGPSGSPSISICQPPAGTTSTWQSDLAIIAPCYSTARAAGETWTQFIPSIAIGNGDASASSECQIPHLSGLLQHPAISDHSNLHRFHHFCPSVRDCVSWASQQIRTIFGAPHTTYDVLKSLGTEIDRIRGSDEALAFDRLKSPCRTLEDCIAWSKSWCYSKFVHHPRELMGRLPLNTSFWGSDHAPVPPRALTFQLEHDPVLTNAVVILSIISAIQWGVLQSTTESLSEDLELYHSSLAPKIAAIALHAPYTTWKESLERAEMDTAAHLDFLGRICKAPDFDLLEYFPRVSYHSFGAKRGIIEKQLLGALSNLQSRAFGYGDFPPAMIARIWSESVDLSPVPAVTTSIAALASTEAFKLLLAPITPEAAPIVPFCDHHMNIRSNEYRSHIITSPKVRTMPNGLAWNDWSRMKLYASQSLTLAELISLINGKTGALVNMIALGTSLLWCDFNGFQRGRLHLPIFEAARLTNCYSIHRFQRIMPLDICAVNEADDDIDLPPFVIHFYDYPE